jgi:two-component system sensor histidine kinase KdpD
MFQLTRSPLAKQALRKGPAIAGIVVLIAALSLFGGYLAHLNGRPVTAALLSVFAVTAVGALLGLRSGVIAGIIASITYNLFFTDPYLKFSLESADDLVPIIALNLSAIASGLIAGRLHDRAIAAESSGRRVAELLKLSQDLQSTLTIGEIEAVVRDFLGDEAGAASIILENQSTGRVGNFDFPLASAEGRIGVLHVDEAAHAGFARIRTLLPIVAMAVQRCALMNEVAEADLVRKSEKFKTDLLSSVSHDLRTPLAAISASASGLSASHESLSEEDRQGLLDTIVEQCGRLDRLTTNILNLGRIEGGLDVRRMPVVDAVETLGSALLRVRKLNRDHVIERQFEVGSACVRADEPLLEQLFYNVLENAIVHTPAGTLVRITTALSGEVLDVSIEDNGPGVPWGELDRVFDRFYQGSRGNGARSGSGLGLSISRGFADAIGGRMRAERSSGTGGGTRIVIEIPVVNQGE